MTESVFNIYTFKYCIVFFNWTNWTIVKFLSSFINLFQWVIFFQNCLAFHKLL